MTATTTTETPLNSLGQILETGSASFGALRSSNDLLDQPLGLRDRLEEDGYLYIREFFDPEIILAGRRSIFQRLANEGHLQK